MNIYYLQHRNSPHTTPPSVIALGNFDGVHLGHEKLIRTAVEKAADIGGDTISAVWTFADSPRNFLSNNHINQSTTVLQLTSVEDKLDIFNKLGANRVFTESFANVRNFSPEQFVDLVLCRLLNIKCAVCGFNFRFGKNGSGDAQLLSSLLKERGVETIIINPVVKNNTVVSSTLIRSLIADGETERAAELLGHQFFIKFPVVYGKQLGRTIGIPTINQNFPENHVIPQIGIYACTCTVGDDVFLGVANVGVRPTVTSCATPTPNSTDKCAVNCETHIINYNGMLYGKCIRVDFYRRLRDEKRFSGIEELKHAIENDINTAINYFSQK